MVKAKFGLMTITSVKRKGRQMDLKFYFRGRKFRVDLMPKAKFELIAKEDVDKVVDITNESCKD